MFNILKITHHVYNDMVLIAYEDHCLMVFVIIHVYLMNLK